MTRAKDRLVLTGLWPERVDPRPWDHVSNTLQLLYSQQELPPSLPGEGGPSPGGPCEQYLAAPVPPAGAAAEPARTLEGGQPRRGALLGLPGHRGRALEVSRPASAGRPPARRRA